MTELSTLTAQRDDMLAKIQEIEETCEGGGVEKILDAIKKQRWYYIKNKPDVMLDRNTGLLWNNPKAISFYDDNGSSYDVDAAVEKAKELNVDGFDSWNIVTKTEFEKIAYEGTEYPYYTGGNVDRTIDGECGIIIDWENREDYTHISCRYTNSFFYGKNTCYGVFLVFSRKLVNGTEYEKNVSRNDPVYTEKERLQLTLDLFVQNELLPIFNDDEITQLYKKIYFEKPELLKQLQELQTEIEKLQNVTLLSSRFDYAALLSKYNIKEIDLSLIKYYEAVQQWTDELLEKVEYYEQEKESVIHDFTLIGLKLSKKYENSNHLTDEENTLLGDRQRYFANRFSLGMNSVKSKILAVKHQADEIEYRIDEIDSGDDAIRQLAVLENEPRASFSFIAENTAKIIHNALKKIEFFEANHRYVVWAINTLEQWTESYRVFKTTYFEDLKGDCESDGIESEIWQKWYADWQSLRIEIEKKLQPMIERELHKRISTVNESEISVAQQIVSELEKYRNNIDAFYCDERKGIYQNFVFQTGGDLQEKFDTESKIYKITADFQSAIQSIIFNCERAEDRIFILKWANSLLDIQIDEILAFVADNDLQKISNDILTEFSALKQKNYEIYLADAKSYAEEQARRDKQYNSLIFKMRKDLMKQ